MQKKNLISLEAKYQEYLKKSGLVESNLMEAQRRETKRAFMGGIQSMFFALDQMAPLPDREAMKEILSIQKQLVFFWDIEIQRKDNQ